MDWDKFREPVKVNERSLMEQFKEFCYLNGGDIVKDLDSESRSELVCKIPGVGDYKFIRRAKKKVIRPAKPRAKVEERD